MHDLSFANRNDFLDEMKKMKWHLLYFFIAKKSPSASMYVLFLIRGSGLRSMQETACSPSRAPISLQKMTRCCGTIFAVSAWPGHG
jgi:hypothetical protein